MTSAELLELEQAIDRMVELARGYGLDFYDMRFEVVPADVLYTFGAYQGMPTRYSHWTFGKFYYRMKVDYDLGLSRIYELVINSDPCYAFLLDNNSLVENKMVCAHVLAHCDFFKNNAMFKHTPRNMVDSMAASAERFRAYEMQYGKVAVEEFLDSVLAIQEHIDPSETARQQRLIRPSDGDRNEASKDNRRLSPYDDLFSLDERLSTQQRKEKPRDIVHPQKDLLLFLVHNSKTLTDWQRDVLTVLREEMLYFWPQIETKVMNEGWATYWHQRIMRELDLTGAEAIDFARTNAGVTAPSRMHINPYLLGVKIWEAIEKEYEVPTGDRRDRFHVEGNVGRQQMFEVREMESDASFLRNYLTQDLIEELDLFLYQKVGNEWRIVEKDWRKVRDKLCASRTNGGYPVLYVMDGDYQVAGELYLKHAYEGMELDVKYSEKTLPHVFKLWGRPVHLETVLEGRNILFSYDGNRIQRKFL